MIFSISVAGFCFEIHSVNKEIYHRCKGYLSKVKPDYTIRITKQDIEDEKKTIEKKNLAEWEYEYILCCRKIANILCHKGIFLIHCSALSVDGSASIFVAQSGTGKSTHSRFWREYLGDKVVMINDDKPFIGMENDRIWVYGSPWNGKHNLGCNGSAQLKNVCFLERSLDNRIEPLEKTKAYDMLLQYIYRPRDEKGLRNLLQFLGYMMNDVRFYRLMCKAEIEAAEMAYEVLSKH